MGPNIFETAEDHLSSVLCRAFSALRRIRLAGLLLRTLLIGLMTLIVSGTGHVLLNPVGDQSSEAAEVVTAITNGVPRITPISQGLISELGYEPLVAGERLIKPLGSCSTPVPIGPGSFEDACRSHDLGYDLLRHAQQRGQRLGPWARIELDRRLFQDLLNRCGTLSCRTAAAAYYTAVTTNSIRQGYGAPTDEPTVPWVGVGLLVVGFALLSDPRGGLRSTTRDIKGEVLGSFPIGGASIVSGTPLDSGRDSLRARSGDIIPRATVTRPTTSSGAEFWCYRTYRRSTV